MAWSTLAPAKVNLDLRLRGVRPDGYHLVRTVLQSIALADRLTLRPASGPFTIVCETPGVPTDASNLAWKGASAMASALGHSLDGLALHLDKHVPAEAGLGGGSADAAAAARLVAAAAGVRLDAARLADVIRPIGADVAYFAMGGTVLAEGIGDALAPLPDQPDAVVVLVRPPFGVSTRDAYAWYDEWRAERTTAADDLPLSPRHGPGARGDWGNDLEAPVAARHPAIMAVVDHLRESGAAVAAMSGSGSACFGLFDPAVDVASLRRGWPAGTRVWVTGTLTRAAYAETTAVTEDRVSEQHR
jgi:4-diphosphocytidyl-2-C-methyl-D-erythritol kinase